MPLDHRSSRRSMRDRGSVRSRGSSSASSSDPREKLKDCCRQFVAFMFTQVGVGALVVSYAIMGAFAFMAIEGETLVTEDIDHVTSLRAACLTKLWNVTDFLNVLDEKKWKAAVRIVLLDYQKSMSHAIKGTLPSLTITLAAYPVMIPASRPKHALPLPFTTWSVYRCFTKP